MKKRLFTPFLFVRNETKRILHFFFRHTFSWYGGLLGFLLLVAILAWLFVYVPTIGEAKRIDAITAEFKAHGCRSINTVAVPMFETHWLLKHFKLEKKVLTILIFGPGAVVPQQFLEHPPYLPDLTMISFKESNPSAAEFNWGIRNPSLEYLFLPDGYRISDRQFEALKSLPHLDDVFGLPPDKEAELNEAIRKRIESTP